MMIRRGMTMVAAALAMAPAAVRAQDVSCTVAACYRGFVALATAFPQTGILAAGGNPVPGVESMRGITLGIIPKTTASLRLSVARQVVPDLRAGAAAADDRSSAATAIRLGTATRLWEGVSSGPVSGIGAIDLLLDAAVLPAAGESRSAAAAFGAGARIGIIRETFGMPGVALTAMYRHVGRQEYGQLCPVSDVACGEDDFDAATSYSVHDASARLTVGKRVGPVGLLGGVGWDRFSTDGAAVAFISGTPDPVRTALSMKLHDTRWTAFANLAYALTVGALVAEGGVMSGGDETITIDGPPAFDTGRATPFGSLALRISL